MKKIRRPPDNLGWNIHFTTLPKGLEGRVSSFYGFRPRRVYELNALEQHYERCCQDLENMLPAGVSVVSKMLNIGFVCVQGPESACLELKKKLEQTKTATMSRNQRIRLIR